jgi:ferritin-like metal-binding protein YciE
MKTENQKNQESNSNSKTAASNSNVSYLENFFINQVKDMYYAEQQLVKALAEMQEASSTEELEDAFEDHGKQTARHIKRLEKVFKLIGMEPATKKCEAIEGLIQEARGIIKETKEGTATRDAALIIAGQKIEHYEIATYGSLLQLALTMDLDRAAELFEKTLEEEEETDRSLTMIAETYINVQAEQETPYSWQHKGEMAEA